MYLYPDTCRLLKNDASIFNLQKSSSSSSSSHQQTKSRIEATVVYPQTPSPERSNRTVYYLETPKSSNLKLDIPITNGLSILNPEEYEYDAIESPQRFPSDLHVDWRTFNLVLWSKCYCRYDQNYIPTLREQELSIEINSLKENLEKLSMKLKREITLDTFHYVCLFNRRIRNLIFIILARSCKFMASTSVGYSCINPKEKKSILHL